MSEYSIPYQSVEDKEEASIGKCEDSLHMNAWSVQEIIYELIVNHMLANDPAEMGYKFVSRYNIDETKSDILVAISYDWKANAPSKRPAIFIQRGDMLTMSPTMNQATDYSNLNESEEEKMVINTMPIQIACIASPIGVAEQVADYIRHAFVAYQSEIQRDFKFRQFRLKSMSRPEIYVESKDNFVIMLNINTVFDEGWVIKKDHLKLRSVGRIIFDGIASKPFTSQ